MTQRRPKIFEEDLNIAGDFQTSPENFVRFPRISEDFILLILPFMLLTNYHIFSPKR